jgi:ribosomal protein L17
VNKTYATELRRLAQERKITSAEYDRLYQEKAVVRGIEGMKLFVEQLPKEYERKKIGYTIKS